MELIKIETDVMPIKSNISKYSDKITALVKDGNLSAIEASVKLKFIAECIDKALSEIKEDTLKELGNVKDYTIYGAKIEVAETGVKYDYKQDDKWRELQEKIKPLQDSIKIQEDRIKQATKLGASLVNEDTGEFLAQKVIKTSTTTPKITLGK